jgi:hypothetical protein
MGGVQALINKSVANSYQGDPNYNYYKPNAAQNAFLPQSACNSRAIRSAHSAFTTT